MKKIILDLCGGTGAWSLPYKKAGYDVKNITLSDFDILETIITKDSVIFKSPQNILLTSFMKIDKENIYGILAAPPCTMFSLARTTAKKPRDLDKGMELVKACMAIIWKLKPKFWVMENPRGLLRKFMGKPAFTFDASEFGCDYNKHTDLWGYFNEPKKINDYKRYSSTDKNTRKLPNIPKNYIRDVNMTIIAIKRSITPQGFALAFYKANK